MAIGPFTPGFVADTGLAQQLSEIGVSLLMFGVGLHFSVKGLWSVRKIAIPGALVQIAVATLLGALVARFWGWSLGAGIVFGLCLSVASTVVLLRALGQRGQIETVNGKIAVGWLIVEDLAMVLALVALPALSVALGGAEKGDPADVSITVTMVSTFAKVAAFVIAMLVIGKKFIPRVLGRVARTGSREMFTLGVLAIALGVAFGAAALFEVSPALGAFFAGVVISESDLSHQAGSEVLPLQEAFTVLFFVSVGMMFDPKVLIQYPHYVALALLIVMVGKSIAALGIVLAFRYPIATALTIAASLAQIGEFSFILISLGVNLGLVPNIGLSVVLATAILSIALNPLIFGTIDPINAFVQRHPRLLSIFERPDYPHVEDEPNVEMSDHVVMIGYGRVGATIGRVLQAHNIPFVVVDQDRSIADELKNKGVRYVFGDASRPGILASAWLTTARLLVVATPAKSQVREIVKAARSLNPDIVTCVRTHDADDVQFMEELGIERIVMGELEIALEMSQFALNRLGADAETIFRSIESIRQSGVEVKPSKPDGIKAELDSETL